MKLKQLESCLGQLIQFQAPKDPAAVRIFIPQPPTFFLHTGNMIPHRCGTRTVSNGVTYRVANDAEESYGDITGKVVADFGCGCGTLGLAASLLEAAHVVGFDQDLDALEVAQSNCSEFEVQMDFVQCDVKEIPLRGFKVDTVVMNPPFGTRKKGADMEFLSVALKIAETAVYSLHKSSTRQHIKRAAVRDFGAKTAEVLYELRFDLRALYHFHKKQELDIAVDLWRFTV